MRVFLPFRMLAALALSAAALLTATPAVPQATRDWNTAIAATESGHRVGNPAAATSLVMFISYSCPHCAEFEEQSDAALRAGYIRSGNVSVEVRHLIRNPIDLAAALATECGPPARFFARHRAMLAAQDRWLAAATTVTAAQQQRWVSGPVATRMQAIASDLDFYALMEPHGLSVAALDRCLTDEARARAIATGSQEQSQLFAIQGTPSFLVDGRLLEGVHSWAALQAALEAAS